MHAVRTTARPQRAPGRNPLGALALVILASLAGTVPALLLTPVPGPIAPATPAPTLDAQFHPKQTTNPWWVEVDVTSATPISGMFASPDGADWIPLAPRPWGSWAESFHVPEGTTIRFLAVTADGQEARSQPIPWGHVTPPAQALRFGSDAASAREQARWGAAPDFATVWVGPWMVASGWAGFEAALARIVADDRTPAIHFYYWGDDISPDCIERGCWSPVHQTWKDADAWHALALALAERLSSHAADREVWIFLETEFNKQSVARYAPLDEALAAKAEFFRAAHPGVRIVMALGNWHHPAWPTWSRTAEAADYVGLQAVRGSTRDPDDEYAKAYEATLAGARELQNAFGKPVVLHDLALSSHPGPTHEALQAAALAEFFDGRFGLQSAGVVAVFYRAFADQPTASIANYYGHAERHWGLIRADGTFKASAIVWIAGVQAARADPAG